jgi:hypothetical protein
VFPAAAIVVADTWGPLVRAGVHASCDAVMARIIGRGGAGLHGIERTCSGAIVRPSPDNARVFVFGPPAALPRVRAALDARVTPAATIELGTEWAVLLARGVHEGVGGLMKHIMGVAGKRVALVSGCSLLLLLLLMRAMLWLLMRSGKHDDVATVVPVCHRCCCLRGTAVSSSQGAVLANVHDRLTHSVVPCFGVD